MAVDVGQGGELRRHPAAGPRRRGGRGRRRRRPGRDGRGLRACPPAGQRPYEGKYPLVSALSRPVIVRHLVAAARQLRRRRRGPRLHRQGQRPGPLRGGHRALAPDLEIWPRSGLGHDPRGLRRLRRASGTSRSPPPRRSSYSIDENLWGRAIECGDHRGSWAAPPDDVYALTRARRAAEPVESSSASRRACRCRSTAERLALGRADRRGRRGRRLLRLGPARHGREPPGRHQEPRGLRVPGRAGPAHGPLRPRGPDPRARPGPREAPARAPLGRAGLRRAVVLAAQGGPRRLRRRHPAPRDRRGPAALRAAGACMRRRPAQPGRALRLRARHLRRRRHLPPRTTPRASCGCGVSAWRPGRLARAAGRRRRPPATTGRDPVAGPARRRTRPTS